MLMKKPTEEEWRKLNLNWIIEQFKYDPKLALEVADYLDKHLELKLEKIEGDPVTYLLKRSNQLEEKKKMKPEEHEQIQKYINAIIVAKNDMNRAIGELQSYINYNTKWNPEIPKCPVCNSGIHQKAYNYFRCSNPECNKEFDAEDLGLKKEDFP